MKPRFLVLITLILLARATCIAALFLDITALTPGVGTGASFGGSLAGVGVTGTLTAGANASFNAVGPGIGASTSANDSPQWSHGTVYAPTSPLDDRVGFSAIPGGPALVTLTFASPMTDLVFHVANLDLSTLDFSPSSGSGITGMTLLSGNGAAGDGLGLGVPLIFDMTPGTTDVTPPGTAPPLAGARSAYGSVLLSGTYTTLGFIIIPPGAGFEDADFTLSTIPEPTGIVAALLCLGLAALRRRRPAVV